MPKITEFNAPSKSTRSQLLIQQKLNQRSKEAMIQREITPEIISCNCYDRKLKNCIT